MRPGGRYNRTSYRDSRPGRHATRAAVLADALDEEAGDIGPAPEPPGVLEICTCLGDGGCFGCDPGYLDGRAAASATQQKKEG